MYSNVVAWDKSESRRARGRASENVMRSKGGHGLLISNRLYSPVKEKIDCQIDAAHSLTIDSQSSSTGSGVGLLLGATFWSPTFGSTDVAAVVTIGFEAESV